MRFTKAERAWAEKEIQKQRTARARAESEDREWLAELKARKSKAEKCRHEWHTRYGTGDRSDSTQCIYCHIAYEHWIDRDKYIAEAQARLSK